MKLINADTKITALLYNEEYEETRYVKMTIADYLDTDTEEGCPQPVNDWVSVKDRLPRDQDIVIVAINDDSGDTSYKYTYFGWYMSEAKCWIVDDEIRRGEVYAWMPLPKPPEMKKNETD